jgi:hypothetical protein
MLRQTNLLTLDSRVGAPEGVVYSTSPRRAEGSDNVSYFVKGPEAEVVFAELAGCLLAVEVGLLVPEVAVCRYTETVYCGSCKVSNALRDVSPWLNQPDKVRNFGDLYDAVVVDAWLANNDRNLGNVLGRPVHGSEIEIVMIDFEKSKTLRPNPIIESGMVDLHSLWPTGELGEILRQRKPLSPPQAIVERIRQISRARCAEIIAEVVEKSNPVDWAENGTEAVARRAERINEIARQVWS